MWAMNGTEPINKEMNDNYYENYKTLKEFKIDTGFRIWKRATKSNYWKAADGGSITYKF